MIIIPTIKWNYYQNCSKMLQKSETNDLGYVIRPVPDYPVPVKQNSEITFISLFVVFLIEIDVLCNQ